jgi:hypothetical protein
MVDNDSAFPDYEATENAIAKDNIDARKASEGLSTFAKYTATEDAIVRELAAAKDLSEQRSEAA